jgi:hypothetical protein
LTLDKALFYAQLVFLKKRRKMIIPSGKRKGLLLNIMGRKVISGVNWHGTLKQKGVKQELGAVRSIVHTR